VVGGDEMPAMVIGGEWGLLGGESGQTSSRGITGVATSPAA
jgi:hypothetical protein